MLIILSVVIEKIHRFLYDEYFLHISDRKYRSRPLVKGYILNKIYDVLVRHHNNWRYILRSTFRSKNFDRYSDYDRAKAR